MRILVIQSDQTTHDSACCIYDGKNITFFLEERYSGVKHDCRLAHSLKKVMETNLTFDKIVFGGFHDTTIHNNHNFDVNFIESLEKLIPELTRSSLKEKNLFTNLDMNGLDAYLTNDKYNNIKHEDTVVWNKLSSQYREFLIKYNNKYNHWPKIEYDSNHHDNHAWCAFYNSGFDKCLSIVTDGNGQKHFATSASGNFKLYGESESVYVLEYPGKSETLYKSYRSFDGHDYSDVERKLKEKHPKGEFHFPGYMSVANLYGAVALVIGIDDAEECGKPMGLSSYGTKTDNKYIVNEYFTNTDLFDIRTQDFIPLFEPPNGYAENCKLAHAIHVPGKTIPTYEEMRFKYVPKAKIITEKNYKPYADLAKDVQLQTQEVICKLIKKFVDKTGIKKVCVSGGYGMNILANSYYVKELPDVEFYFEPLSTDVGIAVGCAMYHYHMETRNTDIKKLETMAFHGIAKDCEPPEYHGVRHTIVDIAKLLYDNKSVAVYTGLAEAGQRALGNRSILFNALNKDARNIVNKIKKREWYRPFAAVVLEEDAHLYFDMGRTKRNLFMTQSYDVISDLIPGVTHVDKTCRVQTVTKGYLYDLLVEFKKLSGHGILLNTSFNLAGQPLVETPKQALETLNTSVLDYLWFENTGQLISKSACQEQEKDI